MDDLGSNNPIEFHSCWHIRVCIDSRKRVLTCVQIDGLRLGRMGRCVAMSILDRILGRFEA